MKEITIKCYKTSDKTLVYNQKTTEAKNITGAINNLPEGYHLLIESPIMATGKIDFKTLIKNYEMGMEDDPARSS